MLAVSSSAHAAMIAHAYDCYPEEACGLLIGRLDAGGTSEGVRFVACENIVHSGKLYTIAPKAMLHAERDAEDEGLEIVGVMHSHTHTEPYPSPTDVAQAVDPTWHYVIVSLKRGAAELRSYHLVDGLIHEAPVVVGAVAGAPSVD